MIILTNINNIIRTMTYLYSLDAEYEQDDNDLLVSTYYYLGLRTYEYYDYIYEEDEYKFDQYDDDSLEAPQYLIL